jgi:hypothetical protein
MTGAEIDRRVFAFALKDVLPLAHGRYPFIFHSEGKCEDGLSCQGGPGCRATEIELVQQDGDNGIGRAMVGLDRAISPRLRKASAAEGFAAPPAISGSASFLLATVLLDHDLDDPVGDAFERVMTLARLRIDSIRVATGAKIPSMSFERVHPLYQILLVGDDGKLEFNNIVADFDRPHAFVPRPATQAELAQADTFLTDGSLDDPVALFRDLASRGETLLGEGDYLSATLVTATASEVLIKTLAYVVVWEEKVQRSSNPAWAMGRSKLLKAFPSTLALEVLPGALGEHWKYAADTDPLWNWRESLYKLRNRIVHEGHRPSYEEASRGVASLPELSTHVADRLAAKAQQYPRSAMILLGVSGLRKRGALDKVRATVRASEARGENFKTDFLRWIRGDS